MIECGKLLTWSYETQDSKVTNEMRAYGRALKDNEPLFVRRHLDDGVGSDMLHCASAPMMAQFSSLENWLHNW